MKTYILLAVLSLPLFAAAQNPIPAKPQTKSILLLNGTAHLGNGTVIENAAIGFKNGKIDLVADARTIRLAANAYDTTIDCAGKQLYPGFIATNSMLGLSEIEAVRATNDNYEIGTYNPEIRSLIAYNTDSKIIPTVRSNGVLTAQIVPRGDAISGTSSIMKLDGWNWEDAVLKTDDGIHINWPSPVGFTWTEADGPGYGENKRYMEQRQSMEKFFMESKAYTQNPKPEEKNLRFEAMRGIFNGSKTTFLHVDNVKQIVEAINFAKRMQLAHVVLVGCTEAFKCLDAIKTSGYPVMLARVHSLPSDDDYDIDQPYKLPAQLQKAGILFCLQNEGDMDVTNTRNLPFQAGTAVAYGLSKEEAISAISFNAAKILRIDDRIGTLEVGKDATLFVSSGDALDMRSNHVLVAFIEGRRLQLYNEQDALYERYSDKYGIPKK
jgi:imidazolonepropionase-like amidohydrolase